MIHSLFTIVHLLLNILMWIIIIQVILSWLFAFHVLNTQSQAVRSIAHALDRVTGPLYRPIRAILPDFGGLDFSPLVLLLLIQVAHILLDGAETSFYYGTL